MLTSTDVQTLQPFLGMIIYCDQFIPELCNLRALFNRPLTEDSNWCLSEACENTFQKTMDILLFDLSLTQYNRKFDILVGADASDYVISAVVIDKFRWFQKVCCPCFTFTHICGKNYSQVEKEALALMFAVQKYHKMIHGHKFLLQTDH